MRPGLRGKAALAFLVRQLSLRSTPSNDASVIIELQKNFMTRTAITALDLVAAKAIIAGHPPFANFHPKVFAVMLYALRANRWAPASPKMSIPSGRKTIVFHESIVL